MEQEIKEYSAAEILETSGDMLLTTTHTSEKMPIRSQECSTAIIRSQERGF